MNKEDGISLKSLSFLCLPNIFEFRHVGSLPRRKRKRKKAPLIFTNNTSRFLSGVQFCSLNGGKGGGSFNCLKRSFQPSVFPYNPIHFTAVWKKRYRHEFTRQTVKRDFSSPSFLVVLKIYISRSVEFWIMRFLVYISRIIAIVCLFLKIDNNHNNDVAASHANTKKIKHNLSSKQ